MTRRRANRLRPIRNGILASHTRLTALSLTALLALAAVTPAAAPAPVDAAAAPASTTITLPVRALPAPADMDVRTAGPRVHRSALRVPLTTAPAATAQMAALSAARPVARVAAQPVARVAPLRAAPTPRSNRALGRALMLRRGWSRSQWPYLRRLWEKESGWNHRAKNPHSSAYGIPQALIDLHGLIGTRYMTSPRAQVRWGLRYIRGRYASPRHAWRHAQRHGWY